MRVDFYLLGPTVPNRLHYACRIIEKAYNAGHRIACFFDDSGLMQSLDDLLWTFNDGSFIPHTTHHHCSHSPIKLFINNLTDNEHDLLINFANTVPQDFQKFTRVIEIIGHDPQHKTLGRVHYKFYRDHDLTPTTHQITV